MSHLESDVTPELSEPLGKVGLEPKYWSAILKNKVGITLPQQIQCLSKTELDTLKTFTRYDWEKNALGKLLGLTSEQTSDQKTNDDKPDICTKLNKSGLDGEYWVDVLKDRLGIFRLEHTENITIYDLEKLKDAVRYDWEANALKRCFQINKEAYNDHKKEHKDTLEKTKTILNDLVKLKEKNEGHTDGMVKSKVDQLKTLMNVREENSVKTFDDKGLNDIIGKINSDVKKLDKLSEGREVRTASELLETASAGLALRGILLGDAVDKDNLKRTVLSTPTDVKLMNPVMMQIEDEVHLSSKAQSDSFIRSLDTMGYSITAAGKGGTNWVPSLGIEGGFSRTYKDGVETDSESCKQTHSESRVRYAVIPTAACELNKTSLKLSKNALQELKNIDRIVVGIQSNKEFVNKKCKDFLKSYGSHINAGVLHFGGVNKFVATFTSETKFNSGKTKSMMRDALNIYASVSHSTLTSELVGSTSADRMKTHDSFTTDYEQSEQAKTRLYTTRKGGPQEVNEFSLWKSGLLAYNSTWALIDRGKTVSKDFVGIWELISNHRGDFRKPDELASSLKKTWEKMSGNLETSDKEQKLNKGVDAMDRMIDKIVKWNSLKLLPEMSKEYLQEVLETVDQVEELTGTNEYWVYELSENECISSFLNNIMELKGRCDLDIAASLRLLLRKLLKPIGFNGKQMTGLMKWAEGINEDMDASFIEASSGVHSIPDLNKHIREIFVVSLEIEHSKTEQNDVQIRDRINAGATIDLALCVDQLLQHLRSTEETRQIFLLNVALRSLEYYGPAKKFKTTLTMEKMCDFVKNLEGLWVEFLVHREKGVIQHEAFLIHTLLTCCFFKGEQSSEEEFTEMNKDLKLSTQLDNVLKEYATDSPFNWNEMTRVTGELAKGNMLCDEAGKAEINDLKEIFASGDNNIHPEGTGPSQTCKPRAAVECVFSDVLRKLGLDKYYPSKISLLDVMVIKKVTENPKLVDLPWLIMHGLLMIDHHSRDRLLPVITGIKNKDEFGLGDFLLETPTITDGKNETVRINPLDVLVATFTCCDNFLKQTLAQKMFVCKLAIPFLYPLGTKDTVMMSLWALRTITVQHRNITDKKVTETAITEKPLPLVTFLRLARPPRSKSKMINDILRDVSHDTFFNHDCNNGTVIRSLTDGLIECSWYITSDTEKEYLPCTAMFLNLRGDASLMSRQMEVLKEISSVMFVIVTAQDLAKMPNTETCQQILQTNSKVILFLISEYNKKERQACIEAVGMDLIREKRTRIMTTTDREGNKLNASELKTTARRLLSEAIVDDCSYRGLDECVRLAENRGIIIDEHYDQSCIEGKTLAENVLLHIKDKPNDESKDLVLPLQCGEWTEYCKLLKKQHRVSGRESGSSSAYLADQIKQKMDQLRAKQVKMCQNGLTPFIKDFILNLKSQPDVVLYFLKWMTLFFDDKSRANLPNLRREYYSRWSRLQDEVKKNKGKKYIDNLKSEMDYAENRLVNASLGLEHLFRELGQIYEAVKESGKAGEGAKRIVENLPEIAAKLLLKGTSLELVDGDTSNVPIAWMSAVLDKLGKIIGEKRFLVLSVLGIQSSGKSTLLNTMFGLQFPVSAGRCTRGVYIQLIPVDDRAELPFHYIVVLDTAGLRAPEQGQTKYDYDNEIATLVIGLGDVTMINVKGENTTEMKDVLQIAVHAFLRMNIVTKHIKNHNTCIFVHQNVPDANADELILHGNQKLLESLDDMTKEAADSENISDIHSFSQIINFDVQKHVWYFSDLWHGNPPMAPANPGYSEKVRAVRLSILREIAKSQTTFLTTSDLSIQLADLWNGILAEDFVFSFRSSLEIKAFNALQSKYLYLEWELQSYLKSWINKKERQLKMLATIDDLDNSFQSLVDELTQVLNDKAESVKTDLKDFFNESKLKEIIIQWKQSKLNQLNMKVVEQRNESKADLLSIKEARRIDILRSKNWSSIIQRVMNKATRLAEDQRDREMTNAEQTEEFETMWARIEGELAISSDDDKELRMDFVMSDVLHDRFHDQGQVLKCELKLNPLDHPLRQTSLEDSIAEIDVKNEDISLKVSLKETFRKSNRELQAKRKTVDLTSSILQEISTYLYDLQSNRDIKFKKTCATEVIQKIKDAIDTFNTNDDFNFTILPSYIVKLAVHVSRHCVVVFSKMQSDYNKEYGVRAKLDKFKDTASSLFKNAVKQSTGEVIAGDTLCTQLKVFIEEAVSKEIPRKVVHEILIDFQMTKYSLIVQMMDELARKDNFKEYKSYISNTKLFVSRWLTRYTKEKMFERGEGHDISRYAELAKVHIKKIMRCVIRSVENATDLAKELTEKKSGVKEKEKAMEHWIQTFCQGVSEVIAAPISEFKQVLLQRKVVDFNNLKVIILNQLDKVEDDAVRVFVDESCDSVKWHGIPPHTLVLDKIWGCDMQCPFCQEPCINSTTGHYYKHKKCHTCLQHRPTGIAGADWGGKSSVIDGVKAHSRHLVHVTCNYLVQCKKYTFNCRACNLECRRYDKCSGKGNEEKNHRYSDCKKYLEEWDIAPDSTNSVSKYWMWFTNTYQHELKDMHNTESLEVPKSWKSITRDEALADLRKIHN